MQEAFQTPHNDKKGQGGIEVIEAEAYPTVMLTCRSNGPWLVGCGARAAVGSAANSHGGPGEGCRCALGGVKVGRSHDLGVKHRTGLRPCDFLRGIAGIPEQCAHVFPFWLFCFPMAPAEGHEKAER